MFFEIPAHWLFLYKQREKIVWVSTIEMLIHIFLFRNSFPIHSIREDDLIRAHPNEGEYVFEIRAIGYFNFAKFCSPVKFDFHGYSILIYSSAI